MKKGFSVEADLHIVLPQEVHQVLDNGLVCPAQIFFSEIHLNS